MKVHSVLVWLPLENKLNRIKILIYEDKGSGIKKMWIEKLVMKALTPPLYLEIYTTQNWNINKPTTTALLIYNPELRSYWKHHFTAMLCYASKSNAMQKHHLPLSSPFHSTFLSSIPTSPLNTITTPPPPQLLKDQQPFMHVKRMFIHSFTITITIIHAIIINHPFELGTMCLTIMGNFDHTRQQ